MEEEEAAAAESVVLPDMSEELADEPDNNNSSSSSSTRRRSARVQVNNVQEAVHPVAVTTTATVQGVPVSLPVGSIIGVANGSNGTFNVITSDQLQLPTSGQFKQMLCVDNGFICEARDDKLDHMRWNGELKATHIVIQNAADESETDQLSSTPVVTQTNSQNASWTECANMAVLPVRCKTTNAELHKSKFGSGGRGRCIKLNEEWLTPSEFEAQCGRASSKDWKRSIRFGGRSLQTLIDEGILRPHATSCTCSACCDDDNAAGPVRLFTPYKRRRRTRGDPADGESSRKQLKESSHDDDDSDSELMSEKNCWSTFVPSDHDIIVQQDSSIAENGAEVDTKYQKLEEVSNKLTKVAAEFKKLIEELKAEDSRQKRMSSKAEEVIETVGLQPSSDSHSKKCANCNRDALFECSLCRQTPYCSTFCQRRDWAVHQVECVRDATETVMLIVESAAGTTATTLTAQTRDS